MADEQPLLPFPDETTETPALLQLLSPDEIYQRADELVFLLQEDRRVERKPCGIHVPPLGEYFSMWANTSPDGGLIVLGIEDDGTVSGCASLNDKNLNHLEKAGYQRSPQAQYDSKRVPATRHDGTKDFLLLFRVQYHPTRVVETCDGKVFIRRGDSKIELKKDEEKRQLRIDKGEVQYEQEDSKLDYPNDFDTDLIQLWAANVRIARRLTETAPDEKILEVMHLGRRKEDRFRPNLACALIFAKDPVLIVPGCKIRFLRFEGTIEGTGEKWNAVKDEWITGSVPRQIEQVSRMLREQIRKFSGLKDNKFQTTAEYPESAWYEAIVNACVHRSYHLLNMNIFVKMFDDRLEIDSPGPFPPPVTPETIYTLQHSRNPFLMEAMHYLDFVRCANEGARRMRDTMLEMNLPAPEFSQTEVGNAKVRVVLRNNIALRKVWVDEDVAAVIGAKIASSLSENEKEVLNFVAVEGKINISEAQRLTGHNWHTSRKLLQKLEQKGILKYNHRKDVAVDRQAHYVLRVEDVGSSKKRK